MSLTGRIRFYHILTAGMIFLAGIYTLIVAVDLLHWSYFDQFIDSFEINLMWHFLFANNSVVEVMQWTGLGLLALVSAYHAGYLKSQDKTTKSGFWFLFAFAAVLMLIEDAGDVRFFIIYQLYGNLFEYSWFFRNVIETAYFLALAAVPVYAVLKYRGYLLDERFLAILLALGFIFYGSAAAIGGPLKVTDFHYVAGDFMYEKTVSVGGESLEEDYIRIDEFLREEGEVALRPRFMDTMVEESLEFLGVLFLLTAAYYSFEKSKYGREYYFIQSNI